MKILAADGKTLTYELEGNAWTYDEVEKTLQNENGKFLTNTKKKVQKVRGLRRTKSGEPWLWYQWNLETIAW